MVATYPHPVPGNSGNGLPFRPGRTRRSTLTIHPGDVYYAGSGSEEHADLVDDPH